MSLQYKINLKERESLKKIIDRHMCAVVFHLSSFCPTLLLLCYRANLPQSSLCAVIFFLLDRNNFRVFSPGDCCCLLIINTVFLSVGDLLRLSCIVTPPTLPLSHLNPDCCKFEYLIPYHSVVLICSRECE